MEGFNADWMPTAYDTAAGTDDGGKHDRRDRRPGVRHGREPLPASDDERWFRYR